MTPDDFRQAVGSFLTGVTVLATRDEAGSLWGMTANSFSSVSLDPPLVSICVADSAGSHDVFAETDSFGISILSEDQQDVAARFASPIPDKFSTVILREAADRPPTLESCSAWMECSVHHRIAAGDHLVLIGKVEACGFTGEPPLGYFDRTFFSPVASPPFAEETTRRMQAGWLVETDEGVLLTMEEATGQWTLPSGPVPLGMSTSDALHASGSRIIGSDLTVSFLYSVIDLPDSSSTCFVYRAKLADGSESHSRNHSAFPLPQLPWEGISPRVEQVLRRYVKERSADRFGIYLGLGEGRLALIDAEQEWSSAHEPDE